MTGDTGAPVPLAGSEESLRSFARGYVEHTSSVVNLSWMLTSHALTHYQLGVPNKTLVSTIGTWLKQSVVERETVGDTRFLSSETKQRAPDYAKPIVGVRAWYVHEDGFLSSLTMREERWMPREEKKATCGYSESSGRHVSVGGIDPPNTVTEAAEHVAPQRGCACGLYAFYDRRSYEEHGGRFSPRDNRTAGVVSAWGEKVILCEYGFKAQYMKLEALVLGEETSNVSGFPGSVREAREKLARLYGVPLLLPDQVEAFSRGRGVVIGRQYPYKAHALIKAVLEWREIESLRLEYRPGSQGG